jgi:transcriptional regulator with XRE-family HTH domain
MITQVEIARRVGLDVSSVNKILNKRQGPVFRKETIRKVFKIARDLGYDFGRLKYAHRRRFPRKELSLGVELYVYHKDGSLYDQGVATVRDISLGGARISDVALPTGSLPVTPFSVGIRPMQKPADDIEIHRPDRPAERQRRDELRRPVRQARRHRREEAAPDLERVTFFAGDPSKRL